jgi:hypothetical protein
MTFEKVKKDLILGDNPFLDSHNNPTDNQSVWVKNMAFLLSYKTGGDTIEKTIYSNDSVAETSDPMSTSLSCLKIRMPALSLQCPEMNINPVLERKCPVNEIERK